jgi:hypothetical protein
MEGAMPRINLWSQSVPRVELDQRSREARLQLERIERLPLSRIAVTESWLRRVVCLFSVRACSEGGRGYRTREPLSNRQPDRTPEIHLDCNLRKVFSRNFGFTSIVLGT